MSIVQVNDWRFIKDADDFVAFQEETFNMVDNSGFTVVARDLLPPEDLPAFVRFDMEQTGEKLVDCHQVQSLSEEAVSLMKQTFNYYDYE